MLVQEEVRSRVPLTPQFIHYRCPAPWGGDWGPITSARGSMSAPPLGAISPLSTPSPRRGEGEGLSVNTKVVVVVVLNKMEKHK